MKISEHISLEEAVKSQTASRLGISNLPTEAHLTTMKITAEKVFEPVRRALNRSLIVSSFYRSHALNEAIGGSETSQHCKGEAIDIDTGDFNNDIFHWIKNNLVFDQLIWEFGDTVNPSWVHVSYSSKVNRKQILRAISENGKTKYIPFDLN